MTGRQRVKRSLMMLVWRLINSPNRRLAGITPWWVVIETTGRRTGKPRLTPLACGPLYARIGPATVGIDPALVRIDLEGDG